jgi:hypothetical protein
MDGKEKSRSRDLLDAASCRVSVAKIRELRKVQSTALFLQMLLSPDLASQQDAYNRLIWICRAALRRWNGGRHGLYWSNNGSNDRGSDPVITHEISTLKSRFCHASRRAILLAALDDEFRDVPRRVCLRVIDMLRNFGPDRSGGLRRTQ